MTKIREEDRIGQKPSEREKMRKSGVEVIILLVIETQGGHYE